MNIIVREECTGYAPRTERYYAIDDDSYDGAEDSGNRHMVGRGSTAAEAIADLLEIMQDI